MLDDKNKRSIYIFNHVEKNNHILKIMESICELYLQTKCIKEGLQERETIFVSA